jgi:PAS domain S-box-containing protein
MRLHELVRRVLLGVAITVVVVVTVLSVKFAVNDIYHKINLMNSASSDNVQWSLSQAEVEFLELSAAVAIAVRDSVPDLAPVRREFDIFYSRINTLSRGSLYADLARVPDFAAALAQSRSFLNAVAPLLDGPDAAASLTWLEGALADLRPSVRALAIAGLPHFAAISDARRRDVSETLVWMAGLTAALIGVLALLAYYFNSLNRQNLRRGRDLTQTNLRMNAILSTSLDAVVVTDINGCVLEFNHAAEVIFRRTLAEVKGLPIGDLIVPPHMRGTHYAGMARMQAGGPMHVAGKGRVRLDAMRADGEIFPVEMALQLAHDAETPIFIAFLRDISRRVAAEAQLTEARDRALAGEKAKADFVAVMSHEIRTPLNGLWGNLSLLRDTGLTARQEQSVHNMEISGALLLNHVNAVLDITQYEAGKMQIAAMPVDLNRMMQDMVDGQSGAAGANGTTIAWGWVGAPMRWALTDQACLQHVLLNLVGNAVKFTPDGSISLELEVLARDDQAAEVEFRVIDTGQGIPQKDLARVFEDFETSDASFGRITAGTGLGLGIARRIVRAMDGEMGAESTEHEGSKFWVRLPLKPAAAPTRRARTPNVRVPATPRQVLVVEDNEINRQVVRGMLKAEGHSVEEAADGRKGVAMAAARRFDLILMDISMPVMDGLQATQMIRTGGGASRDTPIIALSATVMPEQTEQFLAAGMNGFLGKPLSRDALQAVMVDLPGAGATAGPLLDRAQIAATRDSLGPDAYPKLLARFVIEGDDIVTRHAAMTDDADAVAEIGALCHKIASSAAVFGATRFRARLRELELAAHDGTLRPPVINPGVAAPGSSELGSSELGAVWVQTRAALLGALD